jgi:hypothetical protein
VIRLWDNAVPISGRKMSGRLGLFWQAQHRFRAGAIGSVR